MPSGRTIPLGMDPGAAPSSRSFWFKLAAGVVAHPETVTPAIPNAAMASATALTLLRPTITPCSDIARSNVTVGRGLASRAGPNLFVMVGRCDAGAGPAGSRAKFRKKKGQDSVRFAVRSGSDADGAQSIKVLTKTCLSGCLRMKWYGPRAAILTMDHSARCCSP